MHGLEVHDHFLELGHLPPSIIHLLVLFFFRCLLVCMTVCVCVCVCVCVFLTQTHNQNPQPLSLDHITKGHVRDI